MRAGCIHFLLLQQISAKLMVQSHIDLLFYDSVIQESQISLVGLKPRCLQGWVPFCRDQGGNPFPCLLALTARGLLLSLIEGLSSESAEHSFLVLSNPCLILGSLWLHYQFRPPPQHSQYSSIRLTVFILPCLVNLSCQPGYSQVVGTKNHVDIFRALILLTTVH